MKDILCAICEEKKSYRVLYPENLNIPPSDREVFSPRKTPKGYHYRMVQCMNCRLVYSNPIWKDDEIQTFYQTSTFSYEEDFKYAQETYVHYLKKILPLLQERGSLLEIGCSNGLFLEEALNMGFKEVHGIELNEAAIAQAPSMVRDKIHLGILKEGLYPSQKFDVICAFHVFDHLTDPNSFLRHCFSYLKDNGYLFFIHHNVRSLSARILKRRCPIIDVCHIYLFDKKTQRSILEKNGFTIVNLFDVYDNFTLKYWIKLFPFPEKIKNVLIKIKLPSKKIKFPIGNLGVVARKCQI